MLFISILDRKIVVSLAKRHYILHIYVAIFYVYPCDAIRIRVRHTHTQNVKDKLKTTGMSAIS